MTRRFAAAVVVAATLGGAAPAQEKSAADLMKDRAVKTALDAAKASEAQTIEDQIRFCEIPAPSFKETAKTRQRRRERGHVGTARIRQ